MVDQTIDPQDEKPQAETQEVKPQAEETKPQAEEAEPQAGEQAEEGPQIKITLEEAGTLRKKVVIEIPRAKVDAKYDEMFGELGRNALVPGFRIGHAPRRLVEKRFGKEVSTDVRNALVGEALKQAMEKEDLDVLGEPDLKLEEIEVPEKGDMTFSFEVEVAPEFELPNYKGIQIKRPTAKVSDEQVGHALESFRQRFGEFQPLGGPVEEGDVVVANIKVAGEGIELSKEAVPMRVAMGQIEGILLEDLPKALSGATAGQTRTMRTTVPDVHPNEAWRGKSVEVSLEIKSARRMVLPELNDAFARQSGLSTLEELREAIRVQLEQEVSSQQSQAMQAQVAQHLLDNTKFEVPAGVTERYASRLLTRRALELMERGVPREQIERNLQQMSQTASAQANNDMKLSFILDEVAKAEKIEVDEGEVNSRIARIAQRNNRRPERVRSEFRADGRLEELTNAIRHDKVLQAILDQAIIVDVAAELTTEPSAVGESGAQAAPAEAPAPVEAAAPEAPTPDEGETSQ